MYAYANYINMSIKDNFNFSLNTDFTMDLYFFDIE